MISGNRRSSPHPGLLFFVGLFILWGFGYETVWDRLTTQLNGVVVSRDDIPKSYFSHGTSTRYVLRSSDGRVHEYITGATDASLPNDLPVGTRLEKRKWELSFLENGNRTSDFPLYFYSAMFAIAGGLLFWSGLLLYREHRQKK